MPIGKSICEFANCETEVTTSNVVIVSYREKSNMFFCTLTHAIWYMLDEVRGTGEVINVDELRKGNNILDANHVLSLAGQAGVISAWLALWLGLVLVCLFVCAYVIPGRAKVKLSDCGTVCVKGAGLRPVMSSENIIISDEHTYRYDPRFVSVFSSSSWIDSEFIRIGAVGTGTREDSCWWKRWVIGPDRPIDDALLDSSDALQYCLSTGRLPTITQYNFDRDNVIPFGFLGWREREAGSKNPCSLIRSAGIDIRFQRRVGRNSGLSRFFYRILGSTRSVFRRFGLPLHALPLSNRIFSQHDSHNEQQSSKYRLPPFRILSPDCPTECSGPWEQAVGYALFLLGSILCFLFVVSIAVLVSQNNIFKVGMVSVVMAVVVWLAQLFINLGLDILVSPR